VKNSSLSNGEHRFAGTEPGALSHAPNGEDGIPEQTEQRRGSIGYVHRNSVQFLRLTLNHRFRDSSDIAPNGRYDIIHSCLSAWPTSDRSGEQDVQLTGYEVSGNAAGPAKSIPRESAITQISADSTYDKRTVYNELQIIE
jgi:hypothetical protein